MSDSDATARHSRNALRQHLPVVTVASLLLFCCGILWWVANQSRDIVDARKIADAALVKAEAVAMANIAAQIEQAKILTKLSAIEAQLNDLRTFLMRPPGGGGAGP